MLSTSKQSKSTWYGSATYAIGSLAGGDQNRITESRMLNCTQKGHKGVLNLNLLQSDGKNATSEQSDLWRFQRLHRRLFDHLWHQFQMVHFPARFGRGHQSKFGAQRGYSRMGCLGKTNQIKS